MSIAKPKAFWPLTVDATCDQIYVNVGAGFVLKTIGHATYYSAEELRAAVAVAMPGFTVTVSASGYFTITNGTPYILKRGGSNGVGLMGFDDNLGDTANTVSHTSEFQHANGWYAGVAVRSDSLPIRDRDNDVMTLTQGGQSKFVSVTELTRRELKFQYLSAAKTYEAYEGATGLNQAIERWWDNGRARFRYWGDATVEGTYDDMVFDADTIKEFRPTRMQDRKALYEVIIKAWGFIA